MLDLAVTMTDVYRVHRRVAERARKVADAGASAAVQQALDAAFASLENLAIRKALSGGSIEGHSAGRSV